MDRTTLGRTGIEVSGWCLGSMTWGRQTDAAGGHAQIDRALDAGIDFIDTAEMYPVNPVLAETVGDTETIIGDWIAKTGRRDDIVLATKCAGPSQMVRDGALITAETLRGALEDSLRRLRTDHVDLYQLHWPNRGSFHFRQIWGFDPTGQDTARMQDHVDEVMGTLAALVAEGKIRSFGLSNDSTWGTMKWLDAAARLDGPRVATMQNEYSLMCRQYDSDLAEMSHHEDVTLLAFSPLAAGLLTGKYQGGQVPEGSRMALNGDLGGRKTDRAFEAVAAYEALAARHGVDPVHMAMAWTRARPWNTIPIFGATDMAQLDHIIAGQDVTLSDELMDEIDATHRAHPMPY
ncbi:Predicted oxidoreductase [Palleronia salina]|uniref:Predicted oxidoreductase n=1 Tax=Palleronia salina TaxID=313368 RepID=A0A1M6L4U1_9RHOB|nr:aldo/keto reductase [Palleronia salina]SHJ66124.1 Predicted oxidoreductase [Palleronia salina]